MDAVDVCRTLQQEVFGQGRFDRVEAYTTDDVVSHTTMPGAPGGREGIRRTAQTLHAAFDDMAYEVHDAFGSGDRVVIRCTMSGVHNGEFMGRPATGRPFSTQQIHIFRVEDGRVAEHWATRDDLGMMRQLGL
jgi:steroid delta-isomerase-like uncharacterized protein